MISKITEKAVAAAPVVINFAVIARHRSGGYATFWQEATTAQNAVNLVRIACAGDRELSSFFYSGVKVAHTNGLPNGKPA